MMQNNPSSGYPWETDPEQNDMSDAAEPPPDSADQMSDFAETPLPEFAPAPRRHSLETPSSDLKDFLALQRAGTKSLSSSSEEAGGPEAPATARPVTALPAGDGEEEPAAPGDDVSEAGGSGWKTAWAIVREVGETVLLTLVIFLLIQMVVRNFRVVGTSMVNNLHDGQYLIIDKISYNPWITDYLGIGGPHRGDVVVFEPPRRPDEDYVKRIIALPGEKVQVVNGQVIVNDELLDEPFEPNTGTYSMSDPIIVPQDQVFVLGDNRNNSNDSHNWGPLPVENIVGRAWITYWPPELWGTIPRDAPTEEATLKYMLQQFIPSANASNQ